MCGCIGRCEKWIYNSLASDSEVTVHKSEFVIAAMVGDHKAAAYDAVQIQKLIFLIEEEAACYAGGTH